MLPASASAPATTPEAGSTGPEVEVTEESTGGDTARRIRRKTKRRDPGPTPLRERNPYEK